MKAEYLLDCLEKDEIKVCLPKDCNDPFEFLPAKKEGCNPPDTVGVGFISFSEERASSTMWAHYADKHKGVCLEFSFKESDDVVTVEAGEGEDQEIYTDSAVLALPHLGQYTELPIKDRPRFAPILMKVKYHPHRAYPANSQVRCTVSGTKIEDARFSRLYAAKGQEWAYEKEWRLFVTLDNCKSYHDDCYFVKGLTPYISKVLLGVKCPLSCEYVKNEAKEFLKRSVPCARMEADSKLFAVHPMRKTAKKVSPVWCPNLEIKDTIWQKLWKKAKAQGLPSPEALIIKLINESITPSKKANR